MAKKNDEKHCGGPEMLMCYLNENTILCMNKGMLIAY